MSAVWQYPLKVLERKKTKHDLTIQFSSGTPQYLPKGVRNISTQKGTGIPFCQC